MTDSKISVTSLSIPIVYVGVLVGTLWTVASTFQRADEASMLHEAMARKSERAHAELHAMRKISYYEVKIDAAKTSMAFMEAVGISGPAQQREYDLLKYSVEHMSTRLMELKK